MTRALVTGASGFIGSHVVERLVHAGTRVAILRRPGSDLRRLGSLAAHVEQIVGDLSDPGSLRSPVAAFRPEVFLHLAWHGVGNRMRDDRSQVEGNLQATLATVDLAAQAGASAWVGAGSQAEYGPHEGVLDEEASTRPTTLYGATKLAAGHLAARVAALHGLRFAWLRVFSTFGPGDNTGWLIPDLVRALARGERPPLTAGEQQWDYLAVGDAAAAFQAVASTPSAQGVFNLGSGEARRLRDTITFIRDCIDPALPLGFGDIPYRPDQVMFLRADIRRLQNATGWTPTLPLDDALRSTVDWYLRHPG